MATIEIRQLSKQYGDTPVLEDISLTVPDGTFSVLLGPSGSGKTTLLHCIAGILPAESGSVLFDGEPVDDVPIHKRGAVLVDQNVTLFPHMTVEQNIGFGLKMRKEKRDVIREEVKDLIRLVELEGHEKKMPSELSGGQMQRVALARAMAVEPRVLLLDEPFSKLDIGLRASMRAFVKDLVTRMGITTIMVTHDAAEALSMADQVSVLLERTIAQTGTPTDVYEQPVSREVGDFFGERNYLTVSDGDGTRTVVLRPDEIVLSRPLEGEETGTVLDRSYTGEVYRYTVEFRGETLLSATLSHDPFEVGEAVSVSFSLDGAASFQDRCEKPNTSVKKVRPRKTQKRVD